jgi:hypothetical protein
VRQGRAARAETLSRIAAPDTPAPLEVDSDLDAELSRIAALAGRGHWHEVGRELERWTATAAALLAQARTIVAANRAPLEARNQLRALLEAYRAKAARLWLIEDAHLEDIFERAQDALYTAPTDLANAGELVHAYREALDGRPATREVPR